MSAIKISCPTTGVSVDVILTLLLLKVDCFESTSKYVGYQVLVHLS